MTALVIKFFNMYMYYGTAYYIDCTRFTVNTGGSRWGLGAHRISSSLLSGNNGAIIGYFNLHNHVACTHLGLGAPVVRVETVDRLGVLKAQL